MVFFADDELYKVIQDKIKNDLGQVVEAKIGISPQTGLSRVEMFQDGQRSAKIDVKSRMGK